MRARQSFSLFLSLFLPLSLCFCIYDATKEGIFNPARTTNKESEPRASHFSYSSRSLPLLILGAHYMPITFANEQKLRFFILSRLRFGDR